MNSFDFRSDMIKKIRAFEAWAWKDSNEYPENWTEVDTFEAWFNLFKDYVND